MANSATSLPPSYALQFGDKLRLHNSKCSSGTLTVALSRCLACFILVVILEPCIWTTLVVLFLDCEIFMYRGKSFAFALIAGEFAEIPTPPSGEMFEGEIVDPKEVERVCKIAEEWVTDGCGSKSEGSNVKGHIVESRADPKEVERVCEIVQEWFALDLHRHMEAALDGCGIDLTHDLAVDVLQRFKHAPRPAFRFFCWAGQKPGFCHDSRSYNSLRAILGRTRRFDTMETMLEEMGVKGLLTDKSFHIYIRAFAVEKESEKVLGMILELMKRYKSEVGVDVFNCLLDN